MYDTILFPTDGSEEAMGALEHVLDLAETYDSTVHVLYVVNTSHPYGDFEGTAIDWGSVVEAVRQEGDRVLDVTAEHFRERGVPLERVLLEESVVHRAILGYVDEEDVDIIVMGTRGRRGLNRLLLGSVTEQVLRRARIPVLTVRPPDEAE